MAKACPRPRRDPDQDADPREDQELVTIVRAGDPDAYAILYRRHRAAAHGLARRLTRSDAESDDLVSESFARVLYALRAGGGPTSGFRRYLFAALRHAMLDKARRDRRLSYRDDLSAVEPAVPFVDTALLGLENQLVARAFTSLPQRWQWILWHTTVEGESLAAVAAELGISTNGAAALAYRAREGLRQAYLQMHLQDADADDCRRAAGQLGAWVRHGLSRRDRTLVETHLADCPACPGRASELAEVNRCLQHRPTPLATTH
jgi:RNA polymerase sigma factor (sigma-70 family)